MAHVKKPFSAPTSLHASQFELGNGRVASEITTDGEQTFFDQTWDVKLKFVAPYAPPKGNSPAVSSASGKAKKLADQKAAMATESSHIDNKHVDDSKAPSGDKLNVKDLAMPADARDIVYKRLVQQIAFQSDTAVQLLADEFSEKLTAQGWKLDGGANLVTAKSAILRCSRGAAKLTIIVKSADQGSKVTIMTKGLDWIGKE